MRRVRISSGVGLSGTLETEFKVAPVLFMFKLTRGDGTPVNDDLPAYGVKVRNSDDELIDITVVYQESDGYYYIWLDNPDEVLQAFYEAIEQVSWKDEYRGYARLTRIAEILGQGD